MYCPQEEPSLLWTASLLCTGTKVQGSEVCVIIMIVPCRQVVMLMTQMETSQSYKVFMKIEFHKSRLNQASNWGALHNPELLPNIQELHSPRLISS